MTHNNVIKSIKPAQDKRQKRRAKSLEFISSMALRQYNDCSLSKWNEHTEQYEHSGQKVHLIDIF